MALVSAAAFMIVVVGTLAAICIQTPLSVMRRAVKIFPWVIRPPTRDGQKLITKIVEWSNTARKQGLLGLEQARPRHRRRVHGNSVWNRARQPPVPARGRQTQSDHPAADPVPRDGD